MRKLLRMGVRNSVFVWFGPIREYVESVSVTVVGRGSRILCNCAGGRGLLYWNWRDGVLSQVEYVNVRRETGRLVKTSRARYCSSVISVWN